MSKGFKKRRLAIALSTWMMAASSLVHALGMGEIEVSTSLNEPLNAKIKLFSASSEELSSLAVKMASQDAFNRMGIERLPVLRDLEFELVSSGAGSPYIQVISSRAIKEPFLDFILTINWASGQMMREYTLLLDPPVFEKDQQVGRISAATTQPAKVVREQPAVSTARPRVASPGSYGPTSRKDTLWTVAQDMRPDRSVSVPQMMIGLLKKNPEAFDNNNINNLKAGYILRSPEMEVITELSKQQAAAESNRQYQDWLANKGKAAPSAAGQQQRVAAAPSAAETTSSKPAAAPAVAEKTSTGARLQLLTPDEEAKIRTGVGSGSSDESIEVLQRQLSVALESAEAGRQENSDLRMRLEELEKQLLSVQKLLTLKDDTLGTLQADAQQKDQVEAVIPAEEAVDTASEQGEQASAVAEKPATPVIQPEPVETSLLDEVMGNKNYLYAGGGLVVLLLLVAMIMRRRSHSDDEDDYTLIAPVTSATPPAEKSQKSFDNAAATTATAAATAAVATQAAEAEEEAISDDFGAGLGAIQAEESEIDPIAEADVYLAYRRYEQAEALLKEAISADAGRNELKLKLLEIYHATKDVESFEAQAESLYAALAGQDDPLWNQAVEMGRELLPNHPLFGEGGAAVDALSDLGEDVDLAGGEEFNFDDEQPLSEDAADLSDNDLASSLGFSGLEEASAGDAGVTAATTDDSVDLSLDDLGDLDLDLDLGSADELDLGGDTSAESLADELAGFEAGSDSVDEAFDLDTELAASLEGNELDLDAELEAISADELAQNAPADDESLDGSDLGDLNNIVSGLEDVETTTKDESAQDELEIEVPQSEFHASDVESEMDNLLDITNREESSDEIDLDLPLDLDLGVSDTTGQTDVAEGLESIVDSGSTELDKIDPLVDIANLGEMDFSQMSDEGNDDIFDNADDMVGTKLDLAKAYIDMGDQDGARSILGEVVQEGDDDQREEAEQLMQQIS